MLLIPKRSALALGFGGLSDGFPAARQGTKSLNVPAQYRSEERGRFLEFLDSLFGQADSMTTYEIDQCEYCYSAGATVADVPQRPSKKVPRAGVDSLRRILEDERNYFWGSAIAFRFIPVVGFNFLNRSGLVAAIVVQPLGEFGRYRLLLPSPMAEPSLSFLQITVDALNGVLDVWRMSSGRLK